MPSRRRLAVCGWARMRGYGGAALSDEPLRRLEGAAHRMKAIGDGAGMRISRIQLAGLAVVLAGGATQEALADDLTITTATTAPVATANPLNGTPGSITVASNGTITVTAGQNATTMNAPSRNVTNNGNISANNADDVIAIYALGGFSGDITNAGAISLVEDNNLTDSDSDGDLEGALALGTNRHGIFVDGNFTGNIVNAAAGAITVEGNNSSGITVDGLLTGNITHAGTITVTGANSYAIRIQNGGVTGNVISTGSIVARGQNSSAIRVGGQIGGALRVNGTIVVGGYLSNNVPLNDQSGYEPTDILNGGSVVDVRANVGGGVTIAGIGVEDDLDDDGDTVSETTDTDDDNAAQIVLYGSSPAILLRADTGNIVIGPTASGYGLHNRGNITVNPLYDGRAGTGFRVDGVGLNTVDTSDGIANDGQLQVSVYEANAYGISIGTGALVPEILNRGRILAQVNSEGANTVYGVYLEGGTTSALTNSGIIAAELFGETGDATAVYDTSNTLATITNSGTIVAQVIPTDDNLTDQIIPVANGDAVAIDVSASTINVLVEQVADTPFTDDDGVDNDVAARPPVQIIGDIRLGSGDDTFNLLAGRVDGDLSFNAGADTFLIDNAAVFRGRLDDSDGSLSITVNDGTLDLLGGNSSGQVNITNATFGADSTLRLQLNTTAPTSTLIQASGTVTFLAGATLAPLAPVGLPENATIVFLTANSLVGGANVVNPSVTGNGVPFVYNLGIELTNPMAVDGAANGLQASYQLKTAAQLGLTTNQSLAFDPIIDALRLDADAVAAFTSLGNQAAFDNAYEDLMPSYSSAAAELAATAIQQAQGASGNRLAATRLQGIDEVSVWAQEIGYFVSRTPATLNGQEFTGSGFGIALGIDGPLDNGALFGLSASLITSEVAEEGRPEGEIATSFGNLSAYLGTAAGPVDLDFVAGFGAGKMSSQRAVQIGSTFSAESEADWWAYNGHGLIRASVPLALGDMFVITPQTQLTYVFLSESGYSEEGGGAAIDYEVDAATSQRLWGDVGLELAARFRTRGQTVIAPRVFVGYRANLIDEQAERSFRFVSGGDSFTLTDEGYGDGGALVGFGVNATNGYSTFALGYEGEYGDQIQRHSINAAIRFRF